MVGAALCARLTAKHQRRAHQREPRALRRAVAGTRARALWQLFLAMLRHGAPRRSAFDEFGVELAIGEVTEGAPAVGWIGAFGVMNRSRGSKARP